ncbi:hypothetical protein GEMRC1_007838 [Eukaryota sp. GEM-RC1]
MSVILSLDPSQLDLVVDKYCNSCFSSGPSADLQEKFTYADFRYGVLKSIPKFCRTRSITSNTQTLTNLFHLLRLATSHSLSDKASEVASIKILTHSISPSDCIVPPTSFLSQKPSAQSSNPTKHTQALTSAWTSFLDIPTLPLSIIKPYLVLLPRTLSALSSPLKFSDFLISVLTRHDDLSFLAIHPLYLLIRDHKLDHPSWFSDLAALITHDLYFSPLSKSFLKLLPLLLTAPSISVDTLKTIVRRLMTVTLTAPPHFSMWSLSLIYDIITRHPSIVALIHSPPKSNDNLLDSCVFGKEAPIERPMVGDDEEKVVEDSLWELNLLMNHYHPFIASIATSFKDVLEQKRFVPSDFAGVSLDELIDAELIRKFKNLTVQISLEKNLFSLNGGFSGWELPKTFAKPAQFAGSLPDSVMN